MQRMGDDTASRKRKLPEWMMLLPSIEEEEEEQEEPEKKRRRDAQRALVILEEGLARAQIKAREDELLATDDISTENDDDPEAFFQLSQSSVVDEMTTDEALALVGECKNKDDRKQLIGDLKTALREF